MSKVDWRAIEAVLAGTGSVVAGWVFGSAKNGEIRPGSDLDVAVLFDASPSLEQRLELSMKLQRATGFDEIDLLVLNGASPITRFEGISGRPVFCRDLSTRAEFVSPTAREYEESMAFLAWGMAQRDVR